MKNTGFVFGLFLAFGLIADASAVPAKCLQDPSRDHACPHLIYKKAALSVPALDVNKGEVICLCLTDLAKLDKSQMSKVEEIEQQVTFERLLKTYQLSRQDILTLMRY